LIGIETALESADNADQREANMNRKALALVFNELLLVASLSAGVVPGKWEKVQAEKPGTEMIIRLVSGEEIRGAYQEVAADSLLVTVDGRPRTLPKAEVAKITTAELRTGPLWNGPLIGAAVGGIVGAISVSGDNLDSDAGQIVIPLGIAIGAGIGLGVDCAFQSHITLYKAPGVE